MSYSFTVRGISKADAISAVHNELNKVVHGQPIHAADQDQAQAAADAFINLLVTDDTRDISVNVSGSLWQSETGIRQAGVSVTASIVDKGPKP